MTEVAAAWRGFWFAPTPTSTLGVVRAAYGLLALGFAISLAPDLSTFYAPRGILPAQPDGRWLLGILKVFPSRTAVLILYGLLIVGAICVLVGFRSRLATVIVFVCLLSFQRRNPFILNSGDILVRVLGFYLMLAPSGASLSIDRWRRAKERFWEFPDRAPWALRLVQLQLSILYISTVWSKVRGTTWNDGTAVSYALRLSDLVRVPVPPRLSESALAMNAVTYATLAIEVALAVLVWNRKARPWVLGFGLALHLAIDLSLLVGFFSFAIFVGYLAFVPPESMERWLLSLRGRLVRSRVPLLAIVGRAGSSPVEPDERDDSGPAPLAEAEAERRSVV